MEYRETVSALFCRICHKCPKQVFKTVFILHQHFLFTSLQYQMNGKNYLHVFGQIFCLKIFCGNLM